MMKSLFLTGTICLLLSISAWAQDDTPIVFEDQNLKAILLQSRFSFQGGAWPVDANDDGELTQSEVDAVTGNLWLKGKREFKDIEISLTELNHFTKMEVLNLATLTLKDLGTLNLPELEVLFIEECQMDAFVQGEYPELKTLFFQASTFESLNLRGLQRLERLTVADCGLQQLVLEDLPSLDDLNIVANEVVSLNAIPGSVRYVDLGRNKLASLPPLSEGLTHLTVSWNHLTQLPELPHSLEFLLADHNQLETLQAMMDLRNLRHLDVAQNQLKLLPTLAPKLGVLNADHNQLTELTNIPRDLTRIYLRHNQLSRLPWVPFLNGNLYLDHNLFERFPEFGGAQGLDHLSISHNQLRELPDLSSFSQTSSMDFSYNQIPKIDKAWPYWVRSINLSNNQIDVLESEPPNQLRYLSIGNNPLRLEANYEEWFKVEVLSLVGGITEYPDFTKGFNEIKELNLSHSGLEQVPPLPFFLRHLNVSSNPLSSLPNLAALTPELRRLDAQSCELMQLPYLPEGVESLWVAFNQLTSIEQVMALIDESGELDLFVADFRGNLLDESSCDVLRWLTGRTALFLLPQAHGSSIPCPDPHRMVSLDNPELFKALQTSATFYVPYEEVDFSTPEQVTPFNLARVHELNFSEVFEPGTTVNLEGIEYLIGLQHLDLSGLNVENLELLQNLPSLKFLNLSNCGIQHLPELPGRVEHLVLNQNPLQSITALPSSLRRLEANGTFLTNLPNLPLGLNHLEVQVGRLEYLPELPNRLISLLVSVNKVREFPPLPASLKNLYCHSNQLESLSGLPEGIRILYAQHNQLQTFPDLPEDMQTVVLSHNMLTEVPYVSAVGEIHLDHNQLTAAPELPMNYSRVNLSHNPIQDWTTVADWRTLTSLDVSYTQLEHLDVFLANPNLFDRYSKSFNVEGNFLTSDVCEGIQQLFETYALSLSYEDQQTETLDCIDLGDVVPFADPLLEAYLLEYVVSHQTGAYLDRNRDGLIQTFEAEAVEYLYLWNEAPQFTDLTGFEAFINLRELAVQHQAGLRHIPNMSGFAKLEHLNFSNLRLDSFPAFPSNLKSISFGNVLIAEWPDLPHSLESLTAVHCGLESLPMLPDQLQDLRVGFNALETLPILPESLVFLGAENNLLTEIPEFAGLNVRYLYLAKNQISNIEALNSVTSLVEVYLTDNEIQQIPVFDGFPNLYDFKVDNNLISDIEPSIAGIISLLDSSVTSSIHITNNLLDPSACDYLGPLLNQMVDPGRLQYSVQQEHMLYCQ